MVISKIVLHPRTLWLHDPIGQNIFFKLGWLKSLCLYTFSATDANIIKVVLLPVEVAFICGNVDQTKIDNSLDVVF